MTKKAINAVLNDGGPRFDHKKLILCNEVAWKNIMGHGRPNSVRIIRVHKVPI